MQELETKKSLYDIRKDFEEIKTFIEEQYGEVDDNLFDELMQKESDLIRKTQSYVYVINKIKKNKEYRKELKKRLSELDKQDDNLIEFLIGNLMFTMKKLELDKIETPVYKVRIQKNPPSVSIIDENKIPDKYKERIIQTKIDKKAILKDVKDGKEIEGVEITQSEGIRIK